MKFPTDEGAAVEHGGGEGECDLSIGCFASIGRNRLSDGLLAFSRRWPLVNLGVQEMARGALLSAVKDGALSLAVLPGPVQAGLRAVPLWRDEVVVAMAAGHPLSEVAEITPEQLQNEVLLVSREAHRGEAHRFLSHRILPLGPPLRGLLTELSPGLLMERVAAGEAITLICADDGDRPDTVVTRAVAAPFASFPVHACWREDSEDAMVAQLVATLVAHRGIGDAGEARTTG